MENPTCEQTIQMSNAYGKAGKRKCGKNAYHLDAHGRNLCSKHFKKWETKISKQKTL